ncbi:interleukin-13 receptor subunit alpha-1 isoform X2 [Sceloporus undulatus]|uniref:interleukin-13 receptor subunit alpha-1 isoform X2 n=1 Tax=Sceloporus undulatus TaxID=8520 RepID=UPI001C4AF80B|nr:interleukin-13 receptor subunit alpha-1 isoform X2 [Sceloporus undulatus]
MTSIPNPSRAILVPLGKKAVFRARPLCKDIKNGEWVNITLPQNGSAGTGAIDVSCIWHNRQYVECSWRRGENASRDTIYNLTYWHHGMTEEKECTNYTTEGDTFRCSFHFAKILSEPFSVSIHGNSKDIRTVCLVTEIGLVPEIPVKPHPPSIINIRKSSDGVFLNWTSPMNWNSVCYEVEINSSNTKKMTVEGKTTAAIPLSSNERHTFRVRAIQDSLNNHCKNYKGMWSEWSNQEEWDERDNTFKFLLLILIPLCVTILTIILLVYLKRIKLLMLPTIPDPGKFLKGMFEDQSEDLHAKEMFEEPNMDLCKQPAELPVKEEPTHLLIITNRKEN